MAAKRGDVWSADLGQPHGVSPVVILQNEAAEVVDTTIVVPLTERMEGADVVTNVRIEVSEAGLERPHVALCPQLRVLRVSRLRTRLGTLSHEKLSEIEQRLAFLLGLPG